MSKIQKMIAELCPEGVQQIALGNVGKMIRGNGLQKKDFVENGFPCIHYGQIHTFYDTYTYETKSYVSNELFTKLKKASTGDLIIATTSEDVKACCKAVAWLGDGDVAISGDAYIYKHNQNPKYIAYLFQTELFEKQKYTAATGTKVIRVSGEAMEKFIFPLPPLPIQQEIVRILDTFTDAQSNLEQELALRKKQYEYYREKLLTFDEKDAKLTKLEFLFEFKNGLNKGKEFFGKGKPIIMYTNVYNNIGITKSMIKSYVDISDKELERINAKRGDIFFTRTSETQEEVGKAAVLLDDIKNCTYAGFLIKARPLTDKLLPEYCKYCFNTDKIHKIIVSKSSFTTRASLTGEGLKSVEIPVPSLSRQQEIVSILDKFESTIQTLEQELTLRKKQYEYYREKLLTFE